MIKTDNKESKKAVLDGLISLFGQNRRWLLFFGTGTSIAVDCRLGMPALTEHLTAQMPDNADWHRVKIALDDGASLEQALTGPGLNGTTKASIQRITGDHVASIDAELRCDMLLGKKCWPGERLVKALVQRLPPRNPRLSIVTPNYDMLIEYACSRHGIRYTTGFEGELIRDWDWEQAQNSLNQCLVNSKGVALQPLPRVELFKVHGSVNRFSDAAANRQVECDLWTSSCPPGFERVIAAPGEQKFEQYATNSMDVHAGAIRAEDEAMAYAAIGYGFNDRHLEQRMLDRVHSQERPLLVMTLDLHADRIKELRDLGKQIWILVASKGSGNEGAPNGTLVYSPLYSDAVSFDNENLWHCEHFAKRILGD